eukprot:scaffold154985_cov49-Prasinocladus_malaysianus.AAC.1
MVNILCAVGIGQDIPMCDCYVHAALKLAAILRQVHHLQHQEVPVLWELLLGFASGQPRLFPEAGRWSGLRADVDAMAVASKSSRIADRGTSLNMRSTKQQRNDDRTWQSYQWLQHLLADSR